MASKKECHSRHSIFMQRRKKFLSSPQKESFPEGAIFTELSARPTQQHHPQTTRCFSRTGLFAFSVTTCGASKNANSVGATIPEVGKRAERLKYQLSFSPALSSRSIFPDLAILPILEHGNKGEFFLLKAKKKGERFHEFPICKHPFSFRFSCLCHSRWYRRQTHAIPQPQTKVLSPNPSLDRYAAQVRSQRNPRE